MKKYELGSPLLIIVDRWGEIWAAWCGGQEYRMPSNQDILEWLTFIESQCPERTMREWSEAWDA